MRNFHNHMPEFLTMQFGRGRGGPWDRSGPPHWGEGRGGRGHGHGHGRGGPRGHDHEESFAKRILGHGDLRFVILALLEKQPSHGYELIKAIEDRTAGQYVPSPGVIYPTLTFLQEGEYATVTSENSKNLYTITEQGLKMLADNRDTVDAIFQRMDMVSERMSRMQEWFGREEMDGPRGKRDLIQGAFHALKAALVSRMPLSAEQQKAVAAIIEQAVEAIKKV